MNHIVAPADQAHVTALTHPAKGALLPGARRANPLPDLQRLMGNRVVSRFLASGRPPLANSRFGGVGQPLPPLVRLEMERQFGVDFTNVRVHTGPGTQRFLWQSNAEAATIGDAIAMASMPTFPVSAAGRRLLAHELAHVVQQRRGGRRPSPLPGSSLEAGADRAAAAAGMASFGIRVDGASGVGITRQPVAPVQRRDPAAMSAEELQQEIQLLEQSLLDPNMSSAEQAEAEMQLAELRRSLAARQPGPQPSAGQRSAAPQRSFTNVRADQRLTSFDPALPAAWDLVGRATMRAHFPEEFSATLAAAPAAALDLQEQMTAAGPPTTDAERNLFKRRVRTLIRLTALGLMATHRAAIVDRREDTFEADSEAVRHRVELATGKAPGAAPGQYQTATVIRTAAEQVVALRGVKERLDDSHFDLMMVEGSILTRGMDDELVQDRLERIKDATQIYRTPWASKRWDAGIAELTNIGYSRGMAGALWRLARDMVAWRERQITGINLSIAKVYEAFPFMTVLDAEEIRAGPLSSNNALMTAVRKAFDDLLDKVDVAITKIGSADIDPYDLPEAVDTTRELLPPDQRAALDQLLHAHKVAEFYKTMGLTLAQIALVFIPVVGPALAAGLGLAQVGAHLEEMLDRVALSEASTQPDEMLLGVGAPGALEWAMFGIETLMAAFDIRGAMKELGEGAAHFGMKKPGAAAEHAPEHAPEHAEAETGRPRAEEGEVPTRREPSEVEAESGARAREEAPEHVEEKGGAPASRKTQEREAGLSADDRAWEQSLSPETRKLLDDDAVASMWHEMDHSVREVLTHCSDYCIPPKATRGQVRRIKQIVDGLSETQRAGLREFLYFRRADLDQALDELAALGSRKRVTSLLEKALAHAAEEPLDFQAGAVRATTLRNSPGKVTGGRELPRASGSTWIRESGGKAGLIPEQVAKKLRGRTFSDFGEFREAFWEAVAADKELAAGFSEQNLEFMARGEAPVARGIEHARGHDVLELHHIVPIEFGGGVYDLDNLIIVSPKMHGAIHY